MGEWVGTVYAEDGGAVGGEEETAEWGWQEGVREGEEWFDVVIEFI